MVLHSECQVSKATPQTHKRTLFTLLLFLVSPLFFFGGPDYYSPRLLNEFWNLGHLFFFALLAVLLDSYLCSKRRSMLFRIVTTFSVLAFVAFATELIQLDMIDRNFSWTDLCRDLSGGAIVLFWRLGEGGSPRFVLRVISGIILLVNFVPFGEMALDEYRAYRDFPALAGFESESELSRWNGGGCLSRDTTVSRQGDYSAKIGLTTDLYSGVSLHHFPGDWSGQDGLAFSVFNPGQEIALHYRIHDIMHRGAMQEYSNRFNGKTVLHPGWNDIAIPMTDILHGPQKRRMDLTQIHGFGIFVVQQTDRRILFLDNVRLF